jgi:hypothetical protein
LLFKLIRIHKNKYKNKNCLIKTMSVLTVFREYQTKAKVICPDIIEDSDGNITMHMTRFEYENITKVWNASCKNRDLAAKNYRIGAGYESVVTKKKIVIRAKTPSSSSGD